MYLKYLESNEIFYNIRKVEDVKNISNNEIVEAYDFDYLSLVITIGFTKTFPHDLPLYQIRETDRLYAHVDQNGYICYLDINDLNYNTKNIQGIIDFSIDEIVKILNMNAIETKNEIDREFSDYYSRNVNCDNIPEPILGKGISKEVLFIYEQNFNHQKVNKLRIYNYDNFTVIGNTEVKKNSILKNHNTTIKSIYYIPLVDIPNLPNYNIPLTMSFFSKYIEKKHIDKIISKTIGTVEEYLFGYKYMDDYRYIYLKLDNRETNKRLINRKNTKVYPKKVQLISPEFLRRRGGAILNSKKILLIGVGSLGSEVLSILCKSGFTDITIVDNDIASIYNVFRHILGFNSFFYNESTGIIYDYRAKVLHLKRKIESMYPGTEISIFGQSLQSFIINNPEKLKDYKYIISTTGNTIAEKMLNRVIYEKKINTKIIIAWLEVFGIGRHMLLVDGKNKGCFECLLQSSHYVKFSESADYKIYEDTCIGSYTQFGAIDSIMLATDIVYKIIQMENGESFENRHIVKKGDDKQYLSAGYSLQEYYDKTQNEIDSMEYDYYFEGCDCCG